MDISGLIAHLGLNKKLQAEAYKSYKQLKEAEEGLKLELTNKLQEAGLKSAKGEKYSAIITARSDIVITHEQSVIDWLKESPNIEEDAYMGLRLANFKVLANQVLKQTGEVIPGTDRVTKESLSIKENKEKK